MSLYRTEWPVDVTEYTQLCEAAHNHDGETRGTAGAA